MTPEALSPLDAADDTAHPPEATPQPAWPVAADIELRVLQGPQAGCRLAMAPGQTYTLGSADECAVVLVGQQVQPEHAQVQVQADMVQIMPIDGPVWIDGFELPSEGDLWELGSVFMVGRVALCVDEVGMPWPSEEVVAASAALALQNPSAEEPQPPVDDDLDDPDEDIDSMLDEDDPADEAETALPARSAADAAASAPNSGPGTPTTRLHANLQGLLMAGSVLTLLGAVAATVWIGWPPEALAPATLQALPTPAARAVEPESVPALQPPSVVAAAPAPEVVSARMNELARQLSLPGRVSARWAMGTDGPELRIATVETGTSASLLAQVEAARPQTGPVAVTLVEPADMAARFRESLEAGNLLRKFTADPADPRQLSYRASLTQADIPAWEKLFLSFTEAHGNVPPVTVLINTDLDRLGSRIGSVVGGVFPYIVTPEGHRIAPGGSLMGRTVASVQIGEIVFVDGVRYRFSP